MTAEEMGYSYQLKNSGGHFLFKFFCRYLFEGRR